MTGMPVRTVLLAEDSADVRDALAEILQTFGYAVEAVGDGLTAVERASALLPDAVLVDLGIPGIDGLEVARRIRAAARVPAPLLVAVTGAGAAEDVRRSRAAGFDAHLTKPLDLDELARVLSGGTPRAGTGAPPRRG